MQLTRTATVAVNTVSSYARFGTAFLVWFLLTPVIVKGLGTATFGFWALLTALFGLGSLVDFGLGTSVVRYVGAAKGSHDWSRRNRIVSTIGVTYLVLAAVTAVAGWLVLPHLTPWLGSPSTLPTSASLVIALFAGRLVLVTLPFGIFRGLLFGEQLIYLINGVQIGTLLLQGLAVWVLAQNGLGLVELATVGLVTLALEHAAYLWLAFRRVDRLRVSWRLVDWHLLREVGSFSIHSFAVSASAMVLLRTDPILVKVFLPLSAVAVYAIAMKVTEQAHLLLKQFVNALSPLIAELQGQDDRARLRMIVVEATKVAVAPAVLMLVGLGVFGRDGLSLWIDPSFSDAWPILMILMTAIVVSMPELVAANVLTMSGHYRLPARAAVVGSVINVAASLLLARPFGMLGIAAGTLVTALLVNGVVVAAALRRHDVSWPSYARKALWPSLLPGLSATIAGLGMRSIVPPSSLAAVVIASVPCVVVFAGMFWTIGLNRSERRLMTDSVRQWLRILAAHRAHAARLAKAV